MKEYVMIRVYDPIIRVEKVTRIRRIIFDTMSDKSVKEIVDILTHRNL